MGFFNKGEFGVLQNKCKELKKQNTIQNKKLNQITKDHSKNKTIDYSADIERYNFVLPLQPTTFILNFSAKILYQQMDDLKTEFDSLAEDKSVRNLTNKVKAEKEKINLMQIELGTNIKYVKDLFEGDEEVASLPKEDVEDEVPKPTEESKEEDDEDEVPKPTEESKEEDISEQRNIPEDKKEEPSKEEETATVEEVLSEEDVQESQDLSEHLKQENQVQSTEDLKESLSEENEQIITKREDMISPSGEEMISKENENEEISEVDEEIESVEEEVVETKESPSNIEKDQKDEFEEEKAKKAKEMDNLKITDDVGLKSAKERLVATKYVVLQDWEGDDVDDLEIKAGQILTLMDKQEDPWWYMRNENGEEGIVPSNLLKRADTEKRESDPTSQKSERIDEMVYLHRTESVSRVEAVERDLMDRAMSDTSKDFGKKMVVLKSLQAMDKIPPHFSISYFESLEIAGKNTTSAELYPLLARSTTEFVDLGYDIAKEKIASNKEKMNLQKVMTIHKVRNIGFKLGPDINIISRNVKFSLYSKNKFYNILSCESLSQSEDQSTWYFSKMNPQKSPRSHPIFFINSSSSNIYLVFEVCLTISTKDGDSQVSCGWAKFPLFRDKNLPVVNGHHILQLQGGHLFKRGVVIPANKLRRRSTFLGTTTGVSPQLILRLGSPKSKYSNKLKLLPVNLMGSSLWIDILEKYRRIQLEELIIKNNFLENPNDGFLSVYLTIVPYLFDQHDLWDAFQNVYVEHLRTKQRTDSLEEFKFVVIRFIYPLLCVNELPNYVVGDTKNLNKRDYIIRDFINFYKGVDCDNSLFLSDVTPYNYKPFVLSEISYDLIQHYSQTYV